MIRTTIIGGGAMGLLLCSRLVLSGRKTELIVRTKRQKDELLQSGLTLIDGEERHRIEAGGSDLLRVLTAAEAEQAVSGAGRSPGESRPFSHYLVLAVKQTAITPELVGLIERISGPDTWIVCLQNGIGHVEKLTQRVALNRIWLSVTTEGALKHAAGEVAHTGRGMTWLGSPGGESDPDTLAEQKKWLNCLELAGFRTSLSKNITSRVWQKLLTNAVINPLTAILRVTNGELPSRQDAYILMRTLFEESEALAVKLGIELATDLWEQILTVCRSTSGNRSSMLQDVLAGRRSEIEAISGELLRLAGKSGTP
ncbi:2-dehydropantoate 2-reductase [Paenibacillus sp. P25]|nr:2-dehydropantoate 2-reductase [Paenibacillus sp. P25]